MVAVEASGAVNHALHRIRRERADEPVDLAVAAARQELAEPGGNAEVGTEHSLPAALVAREEFGVEPAGLEALDEGVGGERGREQAVVDPATCGGLGEAARIAHEEHPIPGGLRRGLERQEPPDHAAGYGSQPRRGSGTREESREARAGIASRERSQLESGAVAAPDRHGPDKPIGRHVTAEVELNGFGRLRVHLDLRRVDYLRRQGESQLAVEAVGDAAGEDAGAGRYGDAARVERHVTGAHLDGVHARAGAHHGAGPPGLVGEAPIELRAVDDEDLLAP